jgi:hypothetical protein
MNLTSGAWMPYAAATNTTKEYILDSNDDATPAFFRLRREQ